MSNNKDYEPQYEYKNNEYYKAFIKEKEEIKSKYPEEIFDKAVSGRNTIREYKVYLDKGHRDLHKQYIRELADLIFTPGGNYQQFTWDIMSEVEKIEMERLARGHNYGGTGEYKM